MITLCMFTYDARYCSQQMLTETSENTHKKAENTLKNVQGVNFNIQFNGLFLLFDLSSVCLLLWQDYASALLPVGCQTVQDLLNPQKKQLIELNIKDPEHRYRLLAAAEYFYTEGWLSRQDAASIKRNSLPKTPS